MKYFYISALRFKYLELELRYKQTDSLLSKLSFIQLYLRDYALNNKNNIF